jgi:arsenate reductase-like glutaredoxin family protein
MAKIITNIKERILQLANYKGIGLEKFFEDLGLSYGNYKGKAKNTDVGSEALAKIIAKHKDVNERWLISGEGEMLKNDVMMVGEEMASYNKTCPECLLKDDLINTLKKYNRTLENIIEKCNCHPNENTQKTG